tara:strand:+ start:201 stop:1151 length:951 start_codon:yes stop_codon:yes gene_type:complete
MEATNNNSGKTIDELIASVEKQITQFQDETKLVIEEIRQKHEEEFTAEGEDITDKLPTMDEALKLREENEKLKEENEKLNSGYSDIWNGVFNILDDAGIDATSQGKLIGGVRTLKEENDTLVEKVEELEQFDSKKNDALLQDIIKLECRIEEQNDELSKFKDGGVWEEITTANDGLAKKLTELLKENEKLKKNECFPCSTPPPFPEPPQGAPFLWRNAMCKHFQEKGKCDYKEKCGYAHSIEEAQYYQKRCNDYRVKWGEKIYSLNQQINELKLQIPDKQTKRLSPKDKTLLKEVIEGVGWKEWEAHRKLLMRLLK